MNERTTANLLLSFPEPKPNWAMTAEYLLYFLYDLRPQVYNRQPLSDQEREEKVHASDFLRYFLKNAH
jgi:hypothetical protein